MSLANAIAFAIACGAFGGVTAFLITVWLANREMNAMRDEYTTEHHRLAAENGDLRTRLQRAEWEANLTAIERDAVRDNTRPRRNQFRKVA